MPILPDEVVVRFWTKVDKRGDGCWPWTASRTVTGYGQFMCRVAGVKRPQLAHRVAWALANDRWPASAEFICHHCDNRICVRPDHLFLGDHQANMDDMIAKGRHASMSSIDYVQRGPDHYLRRRPWVIRRGEEIGNHKLGEAEVLEMRALFGTGEWSGPMLAERFGCGNSEVHRIVKGLVWTHLPLGRQPTPEELMVVRGRRIREARRRGR